MSNHVFRPLLVALIIFIFILAVRHFVVPRDFGIGDRGFMYGYHRASSEQDWANFRVKYQGKKFCGECHDKEYKNNMSSSHKVLDCEGCHGPALEHPDNPEKLSIDRNNGLCLRCHAKLPYPTSLRGEMKGIDPKKHNPEAGCSECHDAHRPNWEG